MSRTGFRSPLPWPRAADGGRPRFRELARGAASRSIPLASLAWRLGHFHRQRPSAGHRPALHRRARLPRLGEKPRGSAGAPGRFSPVQLLA